MSEWDFDGIPPARAGVIDFRGVEYFRPWEVAEALRYFSKRVRPTRDDGTYLLEIRAATWERIRGAKEWSIPADAVPPLAMRFDGVGVTIEVWEPEPIYEPCPNCRGRGVVERVAGA